MSTVHKPLRSGSALWKMIMPSHQQLEEDLMNTIIYIVGLVVIIGVILSYFGLR